MADASHVTEVIPVALPAIWISPLPKVAIPAATLRPPAVISTPRQAVATTPNLAVTTPTESILVTSS